MISTLRLQGEAVLEDEPSRFEIMLQVGQIIFERMALSVFVFVTCVVACGGTPPIVEPVGEREPLGEASHETIHQPVHNTDETANQQPEIPDWVAALPSKPPPLEPYYVVPCEPIDLISTFHERRGSRIHAGLDLAGVGEDSGLGTPIYSIGRAEVLMIGLPEEDASSFGRAMRRGGSTIRGGRRLPTSADVPGYGRVYFFTSTRGSWRSGRIVVTRLLDGPLEGHIVRYMHLGGVHPDLHEGDILEMGEELAVMGGTGVQESIPHLHIDCEDEDEERVDLLPYLRLDEAVWEGEEVEDDLEEGEVPGC